MTRLLRLTRHPLQAEQRRYLERAYPRLEIVQSQEFARTPEEIMGLMRRCDADVLEAVLPLRQLAALMRARPGFPVIRPVMHRLASGPNNRRRVQFACYERVRRIVLDTEPLIPVVRAPEPEGGLPEAVQAKLLAYRATLEEKR